MQFLAHEYISRMHDGCSPFPFSAIQGGEHLDCLRKSLERFLGARQASQSNAFPHGTERLIIFCIVHGG